jgi:hypothetical protein
MSATREPSEDGEAAAQRELAEELSVHVESLGPAELEIADARAERTRDASRGATTDSASQPLTF